ncbi:N-acetylmuramoyl-L-alanine amidase LytC precursor [Clostridioides difficile]|nr:N-acetylmuramoyl-L-alanine amidase LytC precursor [Clostridioides difficile]
MKKTTKLLATGMLSVAMVAPNVALAAENTTANTESNSDININLQRKSVVLGSKSNASVKFKEKLNADSITLNFMCYDMPLEATLNYNEKTDSYEGVINYNKDPEYLNVWELQSIKINGKDEQKVLNKEDLESMGLNLKDYDVTQEFIISDANSTKAVNEYMRKTSAPVKKLAGATRFETAVEISKQGWKDGSSKVVIVNGELAADGITATPLASTYDAPILLANKDDIPESTKAE